MPSSPSYSSWHVIVVGCMLLVITTCAGWESTSGSILNVHVVPHSHNDPGWWRTFEGYYLEWTKGILSSIVQILDEERSRTFIWAEISYFQRWWEDQHDSVKSTVKRLVQNGQLEFVTAGWVMNDEANTHVIDIINQLTEGHEWLYKTLNTKPKFGWAIDPFGHSPTMPYVLQQMGFEGIVINRAHREIKKEFRDSKHLEFFWTGDRLNSSASFNMLTHMFPWKLYDIPNTCGPDWSVCEKFDFERDVAIPITFSNVKERSETLVNMYKEKAKMFRHNSVLIPLGDDFKYKNPEITRKMMTQYEMLFKHINSDDSLGVNIKFSTLGQYFEEVRSELTETEAVVDGVKNSNTAKSSNSAIKNPNSHLLSGHSLPSYQGDFFTYCDEGEDYWSGYFTTRPFMKGLTRSTQAILRTGEILATLARSYAGKSLSQDQWGKWFDSIQTARRNVALFQHHDGVTGTARRAVVEDYANRLLVSLAQVAEHSSDMALVVLSKSADKSVRGTLDKLAWITEPAKTISIATPRIIRVEKDGAVLVVFNPLAHSRSEVVSVLVNTYELEVVNDKGESVVSQIDPVWDGNKPSTAQFTLHFVTNVLGIGLATYFVRPSRVATLSSVLEYSSTSASRGNVVGEWHYEIEPLDGTNAIVVENRIYRVTLNGYGTIKAITRRDVSGIGSQPITTTAEIDQSFLSYDSDGGAYLFLPRGKATPLTLRTSTVRVFTGPVVVSVHSFHGESLKEHVLRLYECNPSGVQQQQQSVASSCPQAQGIELLHTVDLLQANTEVVTRFKTNIANAGRFYTDSNGFEMRERDYNKNLPIQGNYYPITAAAYIEPRSVPLSADGASSASRFTILSHQAHGVTSLNEGELELMLDRRLNRDDGRGLGESITDNVRTNIPLWLVLEAGDSESNSFAHPALSSTANAVWHARNYPMHTLYSHMQLRDTTASLREAWGSTHHLTVGPLSSPIHERLQILSLAPRDKESDDLMIRVYNPPVQNALDTSTESSKTAQPPSCTLDVNMFKHFTVTNSKETSLSLLHEKPRIDTTECTVRPTEIKTWIMHLSPISDKEPVEQATLPNKFPSDSITNGDDGDNDLITDQNRMAAQDTKTKDIHHEDAVQTEAPNKGGVIETWKEAEKSTPMEKMKVNSMPHESADEPAAVDDTEMIVTPTKTPEKINKDTFKNAKEEFTRQKHKSGGEGRVGKVGSAASKLKDQAGEVSNTTGLYTTSIIFYLVLLVVVVVGGWLLGRRRSHHINNIDDKRTTTSRLSSIWKEREESVMKLL